MLLLWSLSSMGVDTTAAVLAGVAMLLVTVLSWDDLLRRAGRLEHDRVVRDAADDGRLPHRTRPDDVAHGFAEATFQGARWLPTLVGVSLIYFYTHYFFAGNSAHVSAMYVPLLGVAVAVGAPPLLAALLLAYFSNLFAGLTHYGTAPGPIFFGSGDVPLRRGGGWA